jgi:hypothetical protein
MLEGYCLSIEVRWVNILSQESLDMAEKESSNNQGSSSQGQKPQEKPEQAPTGNTGTKNADPPTGNRGTFERDINRLKNEK